MFAKTNSFFAKYETWLVGLLALVFVLVNMQGLHWGIPGYWNVDEVVRFADDALEENGAPEFDQTDDLTYPSLPKYVLYGLGKFVYGLGYPYERFRWAARMLSVLLGAAVVFLVYKITRAASGKPVTALVSSLLAMTFAQLSLDSHFAHNDIYVTFFNLLSIYLLLRYHKSASRLVLYAAFFTVGLAASCKYTGGALLLAVLLVYLLKERQALFKEKLQTIETLFISGLLSFLGFALGTPRALFWMAFYFKRIPHTLYLLSNYNRTESSVIGFIQQWGGLQSILGLPVFLLVISCLAASFIFLLAPLFKKFVKLPKLPAGTAIILIVVITLDIPMMISYIILPRYFLAFALMLFVLASLVIELVLSSLRQPGAHFASIAVGVAVGLTILVSAPRIASVILLFENDARYQAGEYLKTLPVGASIEYTIYPPIIPPDHFYEYSYPIDIIKFADEVVTDSRYNLGEAGLMTRHPDYLIVDSFTYDRFQNAEICAWNQVECDFFTRLLAEQTNYTLIATFTYTLPDYLPNINMSFLNPEIRVYQRSE